MLSIFDGEVWNLLLRIHKSILYISASRSISYPITSIIKYTLENFVFDSHALISSSEAFKLFSNASTSIPGGSLELSAASLTHSMKAGRSHSGKERQYAHRIGVHVPKEVFPELSLLICTSRNQLQGNAVATAFAETVVKVMAFGGVLPDRMALARKLSVRLISCVAEMGESFCPQ
jgi:hypothetical protein